VVSVRRVLGGMSGPTPSPMELYAQAEGRHPNDPEARGRLYHDLMVEHGHIVKAKPGEDCNLPCGWPGLPPAPDPEGSEVR
jgi:hypothetical protein